MLALQVNDKLVTSPVCWEECKVKVFQRLATEIREGDDLIKVFSILTDLPYTSIYEAESEQIEVEIYRAVAFVLNQPQTFRDAPLPKSIKLRKQVVLIPTQLHKMSVGQNFHIRAEMQKAKNLESLLSIACAIYLQPILDGDKFDIDKAKELEKEILEMNIYDIFPIGFFLLSKLNGYGRNGLLTWLPKKLSQLSKMLSMQLRQKFTSWRLSMIFPLLTCTLIDMASGREMCRTNRLTSSFPSFSYGKNEMSLRADLMKLKKQCNPKTKRLNYANTQS